MAPLAILRIQKQFRTQEWSALDQGWAWWVKTPDGKLGIGSTPNQDNPLMDVSELKGHRSGVDVWEHAYYSSIKTNEQTTSAPGGMVNWDEVAARM
jgi:Fe-Mn family superoxide dismutase